MQIYIRNQNDPTITAELVRDVCHTHPEWVHQQLGTSTESEIQGILDGTSEHEYALHAGKEDTMGAYIPRAVHIMPAGGTGFDVHVVDADGKEFLGHFEFDEDGQYEQDDDDIIDAAQERFDLGDLPVIVL